MRFLHTMLRVGNLQRSIDFYTQALGMSLLRTTDRPEQQYTLAFLGYGPATAIVATFVVALPPVIRLSAHGFRMTPVEFAELGQATGAKPVDAFLKIRVPFALPSVMAGINQSLMMAFGMVVIAGIVGSGGLGETIYGAVRKLDIALSVNAAIAIVILTIIIDRISQAQQSAPLVTHVIEMGRALHLDLVAEGVETVQQLDYLRANHVKYAQGWLFAKAMDCEHFKQLYLTAAVQPVAVEEEVIGV